jgi:signal transduction histidine kinase
VLIGIPAATAMGATGSDLLVLSGEGAGRLQQHLDRGDATAWSGLADLRRPDGGVIPVAVSAGAVRGPFGEELGTVLVLRDLRREQEIERMKTQFLSRVGHELRTPLTGILGYAELRADRDVPPDVARPWHEEILAAARQQLRVVRLLEFFAQWGAGRTALRPETLDPAGLVERVVGTWRPRIEADSATLRRLELDVEPGLPLLYADSAWLGLAVDEVIDNAFKYAPGGGLLTVSVKAVPDATPTAAEPGERISEGAAAGRTIDPVPAVEIAVTDQGVGMGPDEIARIFGAFEQGDASDTRRFGGLGLGLAAVVQIVAEHGGWVGCRASLGLGTTVRLVLPIPGAPEQAL